jgi:hypothetical protein
MFPPFHYPLLKSFLKIFVPAIIQYLNTIWWPRLPTPEIKLGILQCHFHGLAFEAIKASN